MRQVVPGVEIITRLQQREDYKMMRVEYLNEQLDLMYLIEDVKTVMKQDNIEKLKKAASSKNKQQLDQALKGAPQKSPDEIKNMVKSSEFKKHYNDAKNLMKGDDLPKQKTMASAYAALKSLAGLIPKGGSYLAKQAAKLWEYMKKNPGKTAVGIVVILGIIVPSIIFISSLLAPEPLTSVWGIKRMVILLLGVLWVTSRTLRQPGY